MSQEKAPIYEALEQFRRMRIVPFDVPGHKHGRGNPELVNLLGSQCVSIDVNSMKPLDNLCHPVSVIKEAEQLAAEAFGAAGAFLMVGGTTSSVQTMILTCCKKGRQDYFAQKRTQKRDQRSCTVRSHTDLCKSGCGQPAWYFAGNEAGTGRESHSGKS